jgi:hypothetical protein
MIRREFLKLVAASPLATVAGNVIAPARTEAIAGNKPSSLNSILRFGSLQFCAEDNRIYWRDYNEDEWNWGIMPTSDRFVFWRYGPNFLYWFGEHTIWIIREVGGELQVQWSLLGDRKRFGGRLNYWDKVPQRDIPENLPV